MTRAPRTHGMAVPRLALLTVGAIWLWAAPVAVPAAGAKARAPVGTAKGAQILEAQELVLDVLNRMRIRPEGRATYERVLRSVVERYKAMGVPKNLLTEEAAREGVTRALRKDLSAARGRQAAKLLAKAEGLGIPRSSLLPTRSEADDRETLRLIDALRKTSDPQARAAILGKLAKGPTGGPVTAALVRLCRQTKDPQLRAPLLGLLAYDTDPAVDEFTRELLTSVDAAQRQMGEQLLTHGRSAEKIIPAVISAYPKLTYRGRRSVLNLLAGHKHRHNVQAFYLNTIRSEPHADLSRSMARRLRVVDDDVAAELIRIAKGKGEFSPASRRAALEALAQTLPGSEAGVKAVMAAVADTQDDIEVRLSALSSIERCVPSATARRTPLTGIREGLAAAMAAEEQGSRMQREIQRVLDFIDQAARGQLAEAFARKRSARIKRDYEEELGRVQALLDGGGLAPEKVAALTKYRDRLRELIAGSELIQLLNDPIGGKGDRADKLKRVDELLQQKLPAALTTKLLELREKLLLEEGKRPDSAKAPRARE